jgi:transcription elongation factor GreA
MTGETVATQPSPGELPERIDVTREGLDQLEQQLAALRDRRPDQLKWVQRATLFLDQSAASAVATGARNDLDQLDEHIAHLESIVKRAHLIEPPTDSSTVAPGSRVTVRYEDDTEETLRLVGPLEADFSRGYVSSDSPIGKALVGSTIGTPFTARVDDIVLSGTVVKTEALPTPRDTREDGEEEAD